MDRPSHLRPGQSGGATCRGELIGANDLWIGCTSLRLGIPIVTSDVAHFRRIDGLGIVQYR